MAKSIFQKLYDKIKAIKTPKWLKEYFDILEAMLKEKLKEISKELINLLIEKILELQKTNMTSKQKFEALTTYARQIGIDLVEREMNVFLNGLVLQVKGKW